MGVPPPERVNPPGGIRNDTMEIVIGMDPKLWMTNPSNVVASRHLPNLAGALVGYTIEGAQEYLMHFYRGRIYLQDTQNVLRESTLMHTGGNTHDNVCHSVAVWARTEFTPEGKLMTTFFLDQIVFKDRIPYQMNVRDKHSEEIVVLRDSIVIADPGCVSVQITMRCYGHEARGFWDHIQSSPGIPADALRITPWDAVTGPRPTDIVWRPDEDDSWTSTVWASFTGSLRPPEGLHATNENANFIE